MNIRGRLAAMVVMGALTACGGGDGLSGGKQLSVSVSGSGTVSVQPSGMICSAAAVCELLTSAGKQITLVASPGSGQKFAGWGGDCVGTSPSCTLTMSRAQTVNATFAQITAAGWGDEVTLPGDGASVPVLAIDRAGRAIAVWRQPDGSTNANHVWASRSTSGAAWSIPERLDTDPGNVSEVRLTVDPASGRGVVLWVQQGAHVDLWARTLDPAPAWGTVVRVDAADGMVADARAAMDAQGNAMAVWSQIGPATRWSIYASRLSPSSGWGAPTLVENNEIVGSQDVTPLVAMGPSGDAVVVWNRWDGSSSSIWGNRYSAAGNWATASEVVADAGALQTLGGYDFAMDGAGNGLLVWGQLDVVGSAGQNGIRFKRYNAGAWQSASTVSSPVASSSFVSSPVLSLNSAGGALVSWVLADGSLMTSGAAAGAAFGSATALRAASSGLLSALPVQGLDASGAAMVAWVDSLYKDAILRSRSSAGAWAAPMVRNAISRSVSGGPVLSVNDAGNAVMAWQQWPSGQGTRVVLRRYSSGN